jgi:hypothetical protein
MLMVFLAASAAIAAPSPAQQSDVPAACAVGQVRVGLEEAPGVPLIPPFGWSEAAITQVVAIGGSVTEPREKPANPEGQLPGATSQNRDPAQALPECREEPRKKRRRKSDYPMA